MIDTTENLDLEFRRIRSAGYSWDDIRKATVKLIIELKSEERYQVDATRERLY